MHEDYLANNSILHTNSKLKLLLSTAGQILAIFKNIYFVNLKGRAIEKMGEILGFLGHLLNGWAKLKSGVWNTEYPTCMGDRSPSIWTIVCCFFRHINGELDHKLNNWTLNCF